MNNSPTAIGQATCIEQQLPRGGTTICIRRATLDRPFGIVTAAILLLSINLFTGAALADQWGIPEPVREVTSANGRYLLRLVSGVPFGRGATSQAIVVERSSDSPDRVVARLALENRVAPVDAYVTDDGRYVVTLDDWDRVGYGDAVAAFYNHQGLIKKYALEEMLAGVDGLGERPTSRELWSRFPHSVSSRWWRDTRMVFVRGAGVQARLAIWLSWAADWLVWRCDDGRSVRTNPEEVRPWQEVARRWAVRQLATPEDLARTSEGDLREWNEKAEAWARRRAERYKTRIDACRFLAGLRRPEDRAIVEALLKDPEEEANWVPLLRIQADVALAWWDGKRTSLVPPDISVLRSLEAPLYRLGHLRVTIPLPREPREDDGPIYVSMFSESVSDQTWRQEVPLLRGGQGGFRWSIPEVGELHLQFPGVPPGRYWIKIVWDCTPPFEFPLFYHNGMSAWKASEPPAPEVLPGDFESTERNVFEVLPGQTTSVTIPLTGS